MTKKQRRALWRLLMRTMPKDMHYCLYGKDERLGANDVRVERVRAEIKRRFMRR